MKKMQTLRNPKILAVAALLLVLVIAGIVYLYTASQQKAANTSTTTEDQRPTNTVDYNPPSEAQKNENQGKKEEIIKDTEATPAPPASINVTIVRAGQSDAGQPLAVRAEVTGTTAGMCKVALAKDGQPSVVKTFALKQEATSYSCGLADIPATDIPVGGEWNLSLIVEHPSQTSNVATQTVTIAK